MATIEQIIDGETLESVRTKINQIINFVNANFPITRSYFDLTDKPAIDGIELSENSKMEDFDIPINSLPNELNLTDLFINTALHQAELVARSAALDELKNAQASIPPALGFVDDDWLVQVFIPQPDGSILPHTTTMKEVTKKAVWEANNFEATIDPATVIVK
ncbi:MAG: hypothetical protein FWC41_01905 [Firmicutes bacterium]|nr:hypothetical protein [Bacillota bacterium]